MTANVSRHSKAFRSLLLVGAVTCSLALSACTKAEQKASEATSSTVSSAPATSTTPTPKPTPKVPTSFDGTCDTLLPASSINIAVGRPVIGKTAFIVGVAEADIGRTAYLNCRYGVSTATVAKKKVETTLVEVGLSLYKTPAQAAARVQNTVESYLNSGAIQQKTNVGSSVGTLLVGNGNPTLVVSSGIRTVAVTMSAKVVGLAKTQVATAAVAAAALAATNSTVAVTSTASGSASAASS